MTFSTKRPGAMALVAIIIISSFALIVMTSAAITASRSLSATSADLAGEKTFNSAEAGLQDALYRLGNSSGTDSYSTTINGIPTTVTITPPGCSQCVVTASAHDDLTDTTRTVTIDVTASSSSDPGFIFGAQAGEGGIAIGDNRSGSDNIISDVASNGSVDGKNSTGTCSNPDSNKSIVKGNVQVANGLGETSLLDTGAFGSASTVAWVPPSTTDGNTSDSASSFSTAPFTAIANNLVLVWVVNTRSSGTPNTPTVSHNGISYDPVASSTFNSNGSRITLFRGMEPTTSGLQPITINISGSNRTGLAWSVAQFSGVDISGSNGDGAVGDIDSTVSSSSSTRTLSVSLGSGNGVAAGFGTNNTNNVNHESGYIEIGEGGYSSPATRIESEFRASGDNDPSVTVSPSNTSVGGIAVELVAANSTVNDKTFGDTANNRYAAQSFQVSGEVVLQRAQVRLKYSDSGSADLDVSLVRDSGGSPSSQRYDILATDTINNNDIDDNYPNYDWYDVSFTPAGSVAGVPLHNGETYWIVLDSNSTSGDHPFWNIDPTNNAILNGQGKISTNSGGTTWTAASGDFALRTWTGIGNTSASDFKTQTGGPTGTPGNIRARGPNSRLCASGTITTSPDLDPFDTPFSIETVNQLTDAIPDTRPSPNTGSNRACEDTTGDCKVRGARSMAAGTIDGSLIFKEKDDQLTISGNLYIKGDLTLDAKKKNEQFIKAADSLGSQTLYIIVEGQISITANNNHDCDEGDEDEKCRWPVRSNASNNAIVLISKSYARGTKKDAAIQAGSRFLTGTLVAYYAMNGTIDVAKNSELQNIYGFNVNIGDGATVTFFPALSNLTGLPGASSPPTVDFSTWREL